MNNILDLGVRWSQCPNCWKNFITWLRVGIEWTDPDEIQIMIGEALKQYHAVHVRNQDQSRYVEFKDEKYKTMFILQWSP